MIKGNLNNGNEKKKQTFFHGTYSSLTSLFITHKNTKRFHLLLLLASFYLIANVSTSK